MTLAQTMLRSAISAYRKAVSPLLPTACRFYPSCSSYAAEAVERHGALRGALMSLKRLGRCHPFHPGGFDPVPAPKHDRGPGSGTAATRRPEGATRGGGAG